ncbi:RNA 2',3'-cyclic phosphodiesterase [Aliikangiella coralliicola]|uniref:RNA 2',3'-cyclic phosphodiesterase n=1 Tax=Aliikangiella coralliicola TaxID=2592383 RepID=A0A545UDZ1_9GAMM|nr:RNA 2',3'-cyclic phosphodiesterase [Aliikangiella coralliicola]TQV87689.1 RNA 2',3'-cyclic phosphodiesterase [Aliikangiella coralliicola]
MAKGSSAKRASSKQYRLFFAIDLSPSTKTTLIDFQDSITDIEARPVPGSNFHITLSFLGNLPEKKLELLLDGIQPIQQVPFEVTLKDLFYWPKPKIMALSIDDPGQNLINCKKQIENQVSNLGYFQFDKRQYRPHLTLFRKVEQMPEENFCIDAKIKVSEVSLMLSETGKSGIYYQSLETWPLQGLSIKQKLLGE